MTLVQKNENGVATRRCKDSEDMFICFDRIHKHDRQTDGEIHRQQGSWDAPEQRWIIFIDVCCEHANL